MKSSAQLNTIPVRQSDTRTFLGWSLALTVPVLVYFLFHQSNPTAAERSTGIFIGVVSLAVCIWVFDLTPAFVPALLIINDTILFDVVPNYVPRSSSSAVAFF